MGERTLLHAKKVPVNKDGEKEVEVLLPLTGSEDISADTSARLSLNSEVMQLFPDIAQAIRILSASILSPKEISKMSITYGFKKLYLPAQLSADILSVLETEMDEIYSFTENIPTIVKEAYLTEGTYATVFLNYAETESVIYSGISKDSTISDVTIESEAYTLMKDNMSSTTDMSILSDAEVITDAFINGTTESEKDKGKEKDIFSRLDYEDIETYNYIKSVEDEGNHRGTIFKVTPMSIIPVPFKTDKSKHLEYYIMLDENGVPITEIDTSVKKDSLIAEFEDMLNGTANKKSDNIELYGKKVPKLQTNGTTIDNMLSKLSNTDRLKDIADGGTLNDIHTVMLQRALAGKKTKMLILPASSVSYIAINYRDNGTGESLLEKIQMLASMRGMAMMARLMSNVRNGITLTTVDATLFDDDPDPQSTMEHIISNTVKNRQVRLPVGILKMSDYVDWAHSVGITYKFHSEAIPEVNISSDESSGNVNAIDDSFEEDLKERMLLALGVPPEFVESSVSPDFATTVVASNALFRLTIKEIQSKLNVKFADYVVKHVKHDGVFRTKLLDVIHTHKAELNKLLSVDMDENKGNDLVDHLLSRLTVELPSVDFENESALAEQFRDYSDNVETYIDKIYGTMEDELGENAVVIKNAITYKVLSTWMIENNFMIELIDIFKPDDKNGKLHNNALLDYQGYVERIIDGFNEYAKYKRKLTKKMEKLEDIANSEEDSPIVGSSTNVDENTAMDGGSDVDKPENREQKGDDEVPDEEDEIKL